MSQKVCPHCGARLALSLYTTCPECGKRLDLDGTGGKPLPDAKASPKGNDSARFALCILVVFGSLMACARCAMAVQKKDWVRAVWYAISAMVSLSILFMPRDFDKAVGEPIIAYLPTKQLSYWGMLILVVLLFGSVGGYAVGSTVGADDSTVTAGLVATGFGMWALGRCVGLRFLKPAE